MIAKKFKLPIQLFPGKRGRLVKSLYFTLKIFPAGKGFNRFGVTISAKTAPKASKRNLVRRTAFNFFKDSGKDLPIADYWITVSSPAIGLSKRDFLMELEKVLGVRSNQ